MKNAKTLKIVMTIVMAIFVLATCSQAVFAAADYINDITVVEPSNVSDLQSIAGKVLGLIQVASAVLAVVLIAVFGFKFIMGSANEKADYQKSFVPLIVGVVVVFAATSIAKLLFSTFTN